MQRILDAAIIVQIEPISEHDNNFTKQLKKNRKFCIGNREKYEAQLAKVQGEHTANEKTVNGLILWA